MNITIVDFIILIFIISYGLLGFKRGVFKQTIIFIGTILVFVISYKFKNIIGDFLVVNLPFLDFENIFNGATTVNIVLYQAIGFLLVSVILTIVFKILVAITGLFEKILRFTIILGIPSKILGLIVGLIEGYVITFIILFILYQPIFNLNVINNSKYASFILNKSPVLSKVSENGLETVQEIYELRDIKDTNTLNLRIVDIILKKDITDVKIVEKLIEKDKIKVNNINDVLDKYR